MLRYIQCLLQEEEAVCCICLQAELDPLAWRSSAPHAASPSPSHDVHSFQRPLSGLVGQPTAEDAQLVCPPHHRPVE